VNEVFTPLRNAREQLRDTRWEFSAHLDEHSTWFRATHSQGIEVERAKLAELAALCNRIKVKS
jgi:hypothetical protein